MKINYSVFCNAVAVAMVLSWQTGCSAEKPASVDQPRSVMTVSTVSPQQASWPEYLAANGQILPWHVASISTEISNLRLGEVLVEIGDTVHKGQVLARFDTELVRIDILQAKAKVQEAEANLEYAVKQKDWSLRLRQSGTLSENESLKNTINADTAKSQLESAKANLAYHQLRLERATILAPDDGVISKRTAQLGAVYSSGSELFQLIRKGKLEWNARLTESQLRQVSVGQEAFITLGANKQISGNVLRISPTLDSNTLTTTVYVSLPQEPTVYAGNFVSGKIRLNKSTVTYVPQSTIVYRDGYKYVMSVENDEIHALRVTTGRHFENNVEIVTGNVQASSRLVLSGGAFLVEGDKVEVTEHYAEQNRVQGASK